MQCDICERIDGHATGCPCDNDNSTIHYCSICDQGILDDDEYVENCGEYVHYDCIPGIRWLVDWLGYKVERMLSDENY